MKINMNSSSDSLLERIGRDFCFLVDDHGFAVRPPQRSGDVTTVRYEHPLAIIQFAVRHGEWQTLVWPAAAQMQAYQASRLAPVAGEMLALYEPARWPAVWDDMQAALRARRARPSV